MCLNGCHIPYLSLWASQCARGLFMSFLNLSAPAFSPSFISLHRFTHIAVSCVWMYLSGMVLLSINTDMWCALWGNPRAIRSGRITMFLSCLAMLFVCFFLV